MCFGCWNELRSFAQNKSTKLTRVVFQNHRIVISQSDYSMQSRNTNVTNTNVRIMSSPKFDLILISHVNDIYWFWWRLFASLFWEWFYNDVLIWRGVVFQNWYCLSLEENSMRVDRFTNLALHHFPIVLDRGWWMCFYSLDCVHPLFETLDMYQTLCSLTKTRVDERILFIRHFIDKTNSAGRDFFILVKLKFFGVW